MKEIVKVLLQEGINETTIHEVLDILEAWNQKTGVTNFDSQKDLDYRKLGKKKVEMTPDEYIRRATGTFKRQGYKITPKQMEAQKGSDRERIEDYKKKIQNPSQEIDEPYLHYSHSGTDDNQEGIHRAIAAKELGHKTIPVHIIHPTTKENKKG